MLVFLAQPETHLATSVVVPGLLRKLVRDSRSASRPLFNNSEICSRIVIPETMVFVRRLLISVYNNAGSCLSVSAGEWRITNQQYSLVSELIKNVSWCNLLSANCSEALALAPRKRGRCGALR